MDCQVSAMWQKLHSQQLPYGQNIPCQQKSGAKDLFKTKKICMDVFQFFFYRDENQNASKLQRQNAYLSLTSFMWFISICMCTFKISVNLFYIFCQVISVK